MSRINNDNAMNILQWIKVYIKRSFAIVLIPHTIYNILRIHSFNRKCDGKISVVILLEHIGDIITCEPVSRYLKRTTGRKVVWIVEERYKSILSLFKDVDMVVSVNCVTECVFMMPFLSKLEVHNLHFDPRSCVKYPFALHNKNHQYDRNNYFLYGSILSTFSVVGNLPPIKERPMLALQNKDPFIELNRPFVAIHLQSNEVSKDWSVEKWRDLVRLFPEVQFIEIGLTQQLNEPNCNSSYCGSLTLVDIAYLINKSAFFIGVDSSVAHFANALDKPSLVLMGSYNDFDSYIPYSCWNDSFKMIHILGPARNISLEQVVKEFRSSVFFI